MVLAPELIWVTLLIVSIALAWAAAKLINALLGPLAALAGDIPKVGGWISGAINTVARSVSNACGAIEHGADALMGESFHAIARSADWLVGEIKQHAQLLLTLAPLVAAGIDAYRGIRALVHSIIRAVHVAAAGVKTLEREFHGIERRVKTLEHDVAKGIGADVLPQIRSLDRELHKVTTRTIPAIESAETALANDVTALGEYVRANFLSSATDAVTAAVVVALGALGLGGLRCNSLLNSLKNRGCGLWSGLEDLLGLFIDVTIFGSLCEAIDFLIPIASDIAVPAVEELTAAIDLMPCVKGNEPAALVVPALHTPTAPLNLLAGG